MVKISGDEVITGLPNFWGLLISIGDDEVSFSISLTPILEKLISYKIWRKRHTDIHYLSKTVGAIPTF